jgi:excisionase family DNA binding protein
MYLSIGQASKRLGVSIQTLRRWDTEGKLTAERTPSGHRRYLASEVSTFNPLGINTPALDRSTVAYARVSSHDQKNDLERQIKVLEMYCASQGWKYEVISDLGS